MTRRLRLGLRVALVATLTGVMTISPASAGWLLNRLGGNSNRTACVTTWQVQPCPPPVCCPPPTCCPAPPQPVCCDDLYYGVPSDASHGDAAPAVQVPPAPQQQPAEQDAGSQQPQDDAAAAASPSDVTDQPSPAPSADAQPDAENAPESESVPTPPVAPSPFQPQPADQPAPADEPEAAEEPAPADEPFDLPGDAPEAGDLFDAFDSPLDEQPNETTEAPAEDDLFDAAEDELPPANDTPAADDAGDDLFDALDAPAADEPAAEEAGDDLFDALGEPAVDESEMEDATEAAEDLFDDVLDEADDPVSTGSQEDLFGPADEAEGSDSDAASMFDELFGQKEGPQQSPAAAVEAAPAAPVLSVTVAANKHVSTAIEATESRLWIDNTGHFSTEGRLIAITETHVRLLKSNGRTCTVELRRLSPSDAAYVAEVARQAVDDADLLAIAK